MENAATTAGCVSACVRTAVATPSFKQDEGNCQRLDLASTTSTLYYQAMVRDRVFIPSELYAENKEWRMFEVLEPENQLETSMNITPRQKMLMVPIKTRYSNGTSNPEDKPVLSTTDLVSLLS